MIPKHPRQDDEYDALEAEAPQIGAYNSFVPVAPDDKPLPRAFPIGFHVAAPGPSHEPPKRVRRRRK